MKQCPSCKTECVDQAIQCPRCKFDLTKDISFETQLQCPEQPYVFGFPTFNNAISIIHELKKVNKKLINTNIAALLIILGIFLGGIYSIKSLDNEIKLADEKYAKLEVQSDKKIKEYKDSITQLTKYKNENFDKVYYLNNELIFTYEGEDVYHKFGCEDFKSTKNFIAEPTSYSLFLKPCPKCIKYDE